MPDMKKAPEPMELSEGEDKNWDIIPLKFGAGWSNPNQVGNLVAEADVESLHFAMMESEHSTTNFMPLSSDDAGEIEFVATGHVRIHIDGALTLNKSGMNRVWELRAKMSDGTYHPVKRGLVHIFPSPVGRPA